MMKKYVVLILSLLFSSFISSHKYYVALTEIEYNAKNKSIQIMMSIAMDDMEFAINNDYHTNLQLASAYEVKNTDDYFYQYLQNHFKIAINKQSKHYTYVGKEYKGSIICFYLEIENIPAVRSIQIENDMLIKYFPNQQNLMKVTIKEKQKSLFLNNTTHKGLLNF